MADERFIAEELDKLSTLRDQGVLTDAEFAHQKTLLLGQAAPDADGRPSAELHGTAAGGLGHRTTKAHRHRLLRYAALAVLFIAAASAGVLLGTSTNKPLAAPKVRHAVSAGTTTLPTAETTTSTTIEAGLPEAMGCVLPGVPAEFEPRGIVVDCINVTTSIAISTWDSWTATQAVGTGTYSANTCIPDCPDSNTYDAYPCQVVLSNPGPTPYGLLFRSMLVSYGNGPESTWSSFSVVIPQAS